MRQEIKAKVKIDSGNVQVIVRKAVFREDGTLDKKYGLSITGEWLLVEERCEYPPECYLPVLVTRVEEEPDDVLVVSGKVTIADEPVKSFTCDKCQDKGFTEKEAGLFMVLCDCDKAREVAAKQGLIIPPALPEESGEVTHDDSASRTGPDNKPTGSGATRKPAKPKKSKAKKKAGKRSR